jgi:hypothetical protein
MTKLCDSLAVGLCTGNSPIIFCEKVSGAVVNLLCIMNMYMHFGK